MSFRGSRRLVRRLGIPGVAISLALMAVGTTAAHTGSPNTMAVVPSGPLTISASGTWVWGGVPATGAQSYVGFAIDWGDTTTGNAIGAYHIGDGTAATNVIMQPTSPDRGPSGTWGSVSHTYAMAGTYKACVIIYDLGPTKPFATTGYHSLQAGGVNHNIDNSVDHGSKIPAACATFVVVAPPTTPPTTAPTTAPTTPPTTAPTKAPTLPVASSNPTVAPTATPFESFLGATSVPTATPPPTATASVPSAPDEGLPMLLLVLLFGSMLATVLVFKTAQARR